jgi:DNA repair photolyase
MSPGFHLRQADGPDNRFEAIAVEYDDGIERPQAMRVFKEAAKSILSRNESPDIPFRFSVNPYRGCAHACSYCYARPYHEYLGWNAGTDFDTQIVAKVNAPELLEKELSKASWPGDAIVFSGVTDPYQPAESALRVTRRCLETCLRHGTPVGLITKSILVLRDLDVLENLARGPGATACLSIPFWDPADARGMEPFAAPPEARFRALEKLSAAGVRTGISVSPVIPGWNDADIPKILKRAGECGASFAFYTLLRLPGAVEPVFLSRLRRDFPDRAGKVEHHLRETHGGELKHTGFGDRMRGTGKMADVISDLFKLHVRRNGLDRGEPGNMRVPREKPPVRTKVLSPTPVPHSEKVKKPQIQTDLFA